MCSSQIDKQDERRINSDIDVTMFEDKTFNYILDTIQKCHLNFQLQVSPYSAVISLKKSVLRDKFGNPVWPTAPYHQQASLKTIESLLKKNEKLENNLQQMETVYNELVEKYNSACYSLSALDSLHKDNALLIEDTRVKNEMLKNLSDINKVLEKDISHQDSTIKNLQNACDISQKVSNKLNKQLNEDRKTFRDTKANIIKAHRCEVKELKKEIRQGTSGKKTKVKKQKKPATISDVEIQMLDQGSMTLDQYEEHCSICSLPIDDYVPDYFMGEKFNPCCLKCNLNADEHYGEDPFASFPDLGLPPSLVNHWIPPNVNSPCSVCLISSIKSHYIQLLNPGDSFMSMDEVLAEFREFRRELFEEQRRAFREDCKQS